MKLIVGLGNPGKDYEHTRHNAGWDAVSLVAANLHTTFQQKKQWHAEIAEAHVDGDKIIFVHPLTFMNLSGEAVVAIQKYYNIPLEDLLVVQDEMDFSPGRIAFAFGGGDAGHNGIASLRESLNTEAFARLRIGIGRPTPPITKEDFVLQKPTPAEEPAIKQAAEAIQTWIAEGTAKAMNTWNTRQ